MLEPEEPFSEHVTLRTRPSDLRRIEAAARVSGVTRSRLMREGALQLARELLREEGGSPERED